jgi:uncharacterized protein (TIGR02118 family)
MHTLLVLYGQPTDPDNFRAYYQDTHLPIAQKLPGIRATRHSVHVGTPDGPPTHIAVFEADFDSAEAMSAALSSPQGADAVADVPNFADGGVQILHFPTVAS